jgi:hypothetical protein
MTCFVGSRVLKVATLSLALSALASTAFAQARPQGQGQQGQQGQRAQQAQAQDGYRNATRLGGTTSFYRPPLRNAADLRRMATTPNMVADLRAVMEQGGVGQLADRVIETMANPKEVVQGAACGEAMPADGVVVDCMMQVGATLEWMAFKPRKGGKPVPSLLRQIRWAGRAPYPAFVFRVTTDDQVHTFLVPKVCGNLSLMRTEDIPKPPVEITVDRHCTPDGQLTATIRATSDLQRVGKIRVLLGGSPVGELTSPSWALKTNKPGTYTFEAVDRNGRPYPVARSSINVEPCPPPPPPQVVAPTCNVTATATEVRGGFELLIDASGSRTGTAQMQPTVAVEVYGPAGNMIGERITLDQTLTTRVVVPRRPAGDYRIRAFVSTPKGIVEGNRRFEGEATCETTINPAAQFPTVPGAFFFDGTLGKDRRVRELDATGPGVLPAQFGQCSPLMGLKFGYAHRFPNNWEIAPAIGVALSLVGSDKVREHALFIDVAANRYFENNAFIGTGVSFWDLTRSDTFSPAWLVGFGVPLNQRDARVPLFFIGEGRLFFRNVDGGVANNYQFWGGLRVHFPRQ